MTYLRLHNGAVVELSLLGSGTPVSLVGKVVDVLPDEVIIVPQLRVYRDNRLDYHCTADSDQRLHINRLLIMTWRYVKVTDINTSSSISDGHHSSFLPGASQKAFADHIFNHYGDDGFCYGHGTYYGDIKADPPSVIFSIPTTDSDGLALEMTP